jgi:MFS family permease
MSAEARTRRGLYGLLAANVVSLSGTRLSMIALPWFVITTTGSAVHTGLAAAAQMTPYVVAKALAGPIVDRLGPRRVIVVAELAGAAAIGTIPVLHALDLLPFGALLTLVALVGAASGPADGGKSAMIPTIADQAKVPLERVTGLTGTIERLATTVGSAGAGAVVALLGPVPALTVNAVTFATAALIIAATAPEPSVRATGRYLSQLRDGAGFIWRDRLLRSIYAMVAATNLLDAAMFGVLLPVWAHSTGRGPAEIGLLGAVMGGAAVAASALAAAIGHRMPRRMTYLVGFLIAGAPRFVVLALDVPLSAIVTVYVVSGFASGFLNPILGAVIFARIPREMVGRVSAMGTSLAWAGIPFGGMVGGVLIAAAGLSPALVVLGFAYLVTTTLPGLQRGWREMDRRVTSGGSRGSAVEEPAAAV